MKTDHIWDAANFDEMKSCSVCGINKAHGGEDSTCSGIPLKERVRLMKKGLKTKKTKSKRKIP
jgi:hypothetical protein